MENLARAERKLYGLALIVAPLLLALSTFFWQDGKMGTVSGVIQVYSFVFWIPALLGLLSLLRSTMPNFAVWATLLISWVCIAGNNFGMDGVYLGSLMQAGVEAMQIAAIEEAMGMAGVLVLYLPGLLFPPTLLLIAFLLWRNGAVPPVSALLLGLGAIAFPISRIPRIELVAHLSDLLLLIAMGSIAWLLLQGKSSGYSQSRAVSFGDD